MKTELLLFQLTVLRIRTVINQLLQKFELFDLMEGTWMLLYYISNTISLKESFGAWARSMDNAHDTMTWTNYAKSLSN